MRLTLAAGAALLMSAPAMAQDVTGDAAAGEGVFRQCQTCHVVENEAGETLAGRNAKTGPNLYGVVGRQAGTIEGFNYGDDLVNAGEQGLTWDEESMSAYLQDPTGFLREYLDDPRARGKMTYRVRSDEDALNVIAYLDSLSEGGGES
jgi:cytochrome c